MSNLDPWRPVSRQPLAKRDLSVAIPHHWTDEAITEIVMTAAGHQADKIEDLYVKGRWAYNEVPEQARARLGLLPGQENILLQISLRDWHQSISKESANEIYDAVQVALHQGVPGQGYRR